MNITLIKNDFLIELSASSQAIHMETDPQTISAYLIYLSQHAPVEEQAAHNDLALVNPTNLLIYLIKQS